MNIQKNNIESILDGDSTQYTIPVYQRYYNWSKKQCEQLFQDLCRIIGTKEEHFFGSIVIKNEGFSKLLIDGQQRITTVSLMLLAMHRLATDGEKEAKRNLFDNITRKCFYYTDESDECQPHILHIEQDSKAYTALLQGESENYDLNSNITRNFLYFYEKIKASDYEIKDFYEASKKLQVVVIALEEKDNAQMIFESLNSTGLALTDGDKIRNFILMNLPEKLQSKCYTNYWRKIEKYANFDQDKQNSLNAVTLFVRDFLTARTRSMTNLSEVYPRFKAFAKDWQGDIEGLLAVMTKFAHYLYQIENAETSSTRLNVQLRRFALLEVGVSHPFLMRLLDDFYEKKISVEDVICIICVVENYIFRRFICGLSSNALNRLFATLYDTAIGLVNERHVSLVQAISFLLVDKSESWRFPNDDEFAQAFATKNVYKMNPKNKVYLFFRLNTGLGLSNEADTSVITKMQDEGGHLLSVEHIMPQRLSKEWKEELGENFQEIHEKWLDTIANLTLTGYNSSYSNKSFQFKRLDVKDTADTKIGFAFSGLPINKFIGEQEKWTETELMERSKLLTQCALTIWQQPQGEDIERQHARETLSLSSEASDFTYKQVLECSIEDEVILAKPNESWKDFFGRIMLVLDTNYHYELCQIANDPSLTRLLQNEQTKFRQSVKVLPGIYAYLQSSTQTKIEILQGLFQTLEVSLDCVVFKVRAKKANSEED